MFFCLLQLVRFFVTENIIRKENGQLLNKPQMRLLLKKILEVPFCKSRHMYYKPCFHFHIQFTVYLSCVIFN